MKKIILRLILGLVIITLLDFVIGSTLKHFYFKQDSGFQYRTTHSLNYAEDKIMIFGSSRANHHYDPKVFESKLKMSSYNTGRDGTYFFYQTALLKTILKRHQPKVIVYDFFGSFEYSQSDYDRLASLLPYYEEHEEIQEVLELKGPFEKFKTFSKIYPYNSLLFNIIMGNMEFNKEKNSDFQGYVPLSEVWNNPIQPLKIANAYKFDSNKLKAFQEFIALCKRNEIKLFVVVSPVFYEYESDVSITTCQKICLEQNIPFYDFTKNDEFLKKPEWYADVLHLNQNGAKEFSGILADSLKANVAYLK
ncbi:hypothetical protein [Maribacter sp. 2308TA10-17]|uniref:hypothetical protein n=1 Tax=Maribacter sp. 2308TA10-17 TaxID=3386276 RepID=UPI0039BD4BFD